MYEHLKNIRFVEVDSESLKQEIFKLRYDVYVSEFGFEKEEDHPSGLEEDIYDPYSIEIAAIERVDAFTERVIGTIRLVLHSDFGFPIENAASVQFIGPKPPLENIAEISRLTVSKDYRRRERDGLHGVESYIKVYEGGRLFFNERGRDDHLRLQPYIVLGLYKKMYQVSKRLGITHWYLITEKKLWYTLKRFNFIFHQIGKPVHYHGKRIPYLGIIDEIEQNLMEKQIGFYQDFLTGLDKQYWPTELRERKNHV